MKKVTRKIFLITAIALALGILFAYFASTKTQCMHFSCFARIGIIGFVCSIVIQCWITIFSYYALEFFNEKLIDIWTASAFDDLLKKSNARLDLQRTRRVNFISCALLCATTFAIIAIFDCFNAK